MKPKCCSTFKPCYQCSLKRAQKLREKRKQIKLGRKTKANKKNNAELKTIFTKLNIRHCEYPGCFSTFHLTYAHSRKRRFCTTDESMKEVALICLVHHDQIERLPHAEMFKAISEIINKRISREYEAA